MNRYGWICAFGLALAFAGGAVAATKTTTPAVPKGWRFTMAAGDPAAGEGVFARMECFSCHRVQGRTFVGRVDTGGQGPDLGPGYAQLPGEYLAESIVNRHKVIAGSEPRYRGEDRRSSKMGDYGEIMTIRELRDVVAYLKALR